MKVIGRKNLEYGKSISKMLMVYFVVLLIIITLVILYKDMIILWSTLLALTVLVLERLVALVRFKKLPNDLVIMHRDCIEIRSNYTPKIIKYQDLVDIEISPKLNKFYIQTIYNTKIFVKYLDNPMAVKKEILDYKKKYFK